MKNKFTTLDQLNKSDNKALASVGVLLGNENRSATMVVRNNDIVCHETNTDQFEMLPISIALKKYNWLREKYYFNAIPADYDEVARKCATQKEQVGYFIYVKEGVNVKLPCQAAMYMVSENLEQVIHNIIVLEDNSSLQLVAGCTTHSSVSKGTHYAVEENYIGKNAKFVSTMVHAWGSEVEVYPRTGTVVKEEGQYESNYICLKAAKLVKTNPQTFLEGKRASAKYLTIVLGTPGSIIETGGSIFLNAKDTSAELLHRGVSTGGVMIQGGMLIGNAPCRAHVDCAGMLLDNTGKGYIESIPGLKSLHSDARMSHEASVGKIAPEQVEYLMSRGLEEQEAISLLIRGFLGVDIEGLGEELDAQIEGIAEIAGHGEE